MWPFDRAEQKRRLVQSLGKQYPKTPDILELQQQQYKLMFVCDDMMKAHKNYELIKKHGQPVGRGFTQQPFNYHVGKHTGRGLPFQAKEGLKVKGELHAVLSERIPALDNHYDNGVQFARVRVNILVVNRDHQLLDIGSEEFVKNFPPGMIRTVPELGLRHYLSDRQVCVIRADMYVAIKKYWFRTEQDPAFPRLFPERPKDELVWLPRYYKYPINFNRPLPKKE